jgi:C_GCAxxG_C_C family probable redox protein
MNKVEKATDLFKQGYLCSQSVFAAFCEDYGIDRELGLKLSKFLGFGYLFRGDYCGAVSAALMIYGLKYCSGEIYNDLSDEVFFQLSKEHIRKFKEKHGSCNCNELLGGDVSTGEGIQLIREMGYFDTRCPGFVKDSTEIITQIIKKMEQRESKGYFEKVADQWDNMQESFFSDSARKKAFEIANIKSGDIIADIGAGTGYITEGLINNDVKVIAVDQSPSMLKEMKKKFSTFENIDYRVGDSENLPIKDFEADYAFANMYLHHVDHPEKSIKEMARILKNGGKLFVMDLDEHTHEFLRTEQFDKWLGFKRNDIKKWFESAGLKNIVVDCVGDKCCADSESKKTERAEISIFIGYGEK